MNFFLATIARDVSIHLRRPAAFVNPLVFFLVVISLFPLGIGPSPDQLSLIAPGVIWVAALLATLMSMDLMFRSDYEDGTLEQVVLSGRSLVVFVVAKVCMHWLLTGLPLVLLTPLMGLVLYLETPGTVALSFSLLLISPTLSLVGSIGAALTVGLPRGSLLVSILILPLYVPVLILGTAMVQAAGNGSDVTGYAYWLLAILLMALALAPLAAAASIRIATDQ